MARIGRTSLAVVNHRWYFETSVSDQFHQIITHLPDISNCIIPFHGKPVWISVEGRHFNVDLWRYYNSNRCLPPQRIQTAGSVFWFKVSLQFLNLINFGKYILQLCEESSFFKNNNKNYMYIFRYLSSLHTESTEIFVIHDLTYRIL